MSNRTIKKLTIRALSNDWVSAFATRLVGCGIPIFMLHRTYPDNTPGEIQTPAHLRRCLNYLKIKGYHFTSVAEILHSITSNTPLPRKSVAFTIDDGFHDQASLAAPVFIEFGCPVTIFLVTDFIDGKSWPWFSKVQHLVDQARVTHLELEINQQKKRYSLVSSSDKNIARRKITNLIKSTEWEYLDPILNKLSESLKVEIPDLPPEQFQPITWNRIKELENAGISFGPHTLTHPILSKVDTETAEKEILGSWQRLKSTLKNPVPVFCYPNGELADFGDREIQLLKNTDMVGALSTIPMQYRTDLKSTDITYKMPRYSLPDSFSDFIMYCSWVELAKEKLRGQQI